MDPTIHLDAIEWLEDNYDPRGMKLLNDQALKRLIDKHYPGGFTAFCAATWASVEAWEAEKPNLIQPKDTNV